MGLNPLQVYNLGCKQKHFENPFPISILIHPILITRIVNLSIESAIVPQDLKFAKVVPLYKKNSHLEVCNYRPISLLSSVSENS